MLTHAFMRTDNSHIRTYPRTHALILHKQNYSLVDALTIKKRLHLLVFWKIHFQCQLLTLERKWGSGNVRMSVNGQQSAKYSQINKLSLRIFEIPAAKYHLHIQHSSVIKSIHL